MSVDTVKMNRYNYRKKKYENIPSDNHLKEHNCFTQQLHQVCNKKKSSSFKLIVLHSKQKPKRTKLIL